MGRKRPIFKEKNLKSQDIHFRAKLLSQKSFSLMSYSSKKFFVGPPNSPVTGIKQYLILKIYIYENNSVSKNKLFKLATYQILMRFKLQSKSLSITHTWRKDYLVGLNKKEKLQLRKELF